VNFYGFTIYADPNQFGAAQDHVHLIGKLRMKLFDTANSTVIGTQPATVNQLQILVKDKRFTREDHGLTICDVANKDKTKDKMDKHATSRISSEKVLNCLEQIPGAEGTAAYIKLMLYLDEALLCPKTTLEDRLWCMIYVASFLRRWRHHVHLSPNAQSSNFITPNAWACVEINLGFFIKLLKMGKGQLIPICSSQMVEEAFRALRSLSTFGLTQINATTKTALENFGKINLMMDVAFNLRNDFKFIDSRSLKDVVAPEPLMLEFLEPALIVDVIKNAQYQVEQDCIKLGIFEPEINPMDIFRMPMMPEELIERGASQSQSQAIERQMETR
jgi:hypothetical protein